MDVFARLPESLMRETVALMPEPEDVLDLHLDVIREKAGCLTGDAFFVRVEFDPFFETYVVRWEESDGDFWHETTAMLDVADNAPWTAGKPVLFCFDDAFAGRCRLVKVDEDGMSFEAEFHRAQEWRRLEAAWDDYMAQQDDLWQF